MYKNLNEKISLTEEHYVEMSMRHKMNPVIENDEMFGYEIK